jgi:hypothetical protein
MAEAATTGTPTAPGVFSRKASGLVRVGSSLDVFIFNVGLVSVGIGGLPEVRRRLRVPALPGRDRMSRARPHRNRTGD